MNEPLEQKLRELRGVKMQAADAAAVMAALDWTPSGLVELLTSYPLMNARLTIDEADDESGLGVEMRWLNSGEIISEALEAYPGVAAAHSRYLPIGTCLLGSGDPYFVQANDVALPVYRIPHTAVGSAQELLAGEIERVAPSLEAFLTVARFR